jgi:hypothetical protein
VVRQVEDRGLSVGVGKQYPVPWKVVEAEAESDHHHHQQPGLRICLTLLWNQMVALPAIEETRSPPNVYV